MRVELGEVWTVHGETPDMVYGRLREAAHVSSYAFERACEELEYLLTDDHWRSVGAGYAKVNDFLRSVDLSAFNVLERRPELVRRIKELEPETSNRAIAAAIGVAPATVDRDVHTASHEAEPEAETQERLDRDEHAASSEAPEPDEAEGDEHDVADDADEANTPDDAEEDEQVTGDTDAVPTRQVDEAVDEDAFEAAAVEDLPDFLWGDDWLPGERRPAYARYRELPTDLQPTVAALLAQPGICVPDMRRMLAHIATMDAAQQAELARLQASADAYAQSCAITMALNRPPPPHPCLMLVLEVQRELGGLTHRLAHMATRYPEFPGSSEVIAWVGRLALVAGEADAVMHTLQACKEVASADRADVSAVV